MYYKASKSIHDYPEFQSYLTDPEQEPFLKKAGHHLNIIVRECCLNEYSIEWENTGYIRENLKTPRMTSCSIPSLLPKKLRDASTGYFIRGEFLTVAYFGNNPDCGYEPNSGELLRKFQSDLSFFERKPLLFRFTDVLPSDFFFLGKRDPASSRGATYLLENKELLFENCALVQAALEMGNQVTILVTSEDPKEFSEIQHVIRSRLKNIKFGLMVESEFACRNLSKFIDSEAFFPGPSDLTADKLKISRGAFDGGKHSNELLGEICEDFLLGLKDLHNDVNIFTIKDMNHALIVPDSFHRTYIYTTPELFLTEEKHRLLLKCSSLS